MGPSAEEQSVVPDLSIVIASYNAAAWLESTLDSLVEAASRTVQSVEIVLVDDGSTDGTADVLDRYAQHSPVPIRVKTQENKGRFLAFWAAAQEARAPRIVIYGARMLMRPDALAYLDEVDPQIRAGHVWNGHVVTDPDGPLVTRFWEVPTYVFWGEYLKNPRPMSITPENFDRVPKGTGSLLIDRQLFIDACIAAWPEDNAALISDDTKLLRYVVERHPMRIDPGFGAIYRPRVSVRSFLSHAFTRGTLFVDSYAGTSVARNLALVGLSLAPAVLLVLIAVAFATQAIWAFVVILLIGIAGVAAPAAVAGLRRCPGRAVLSYFTYIVPFSAVFWAGLVRGVVIHRRSFVRDAREKNPTA